MTVTISPKNNHFERSEALAADPLESDGEYLAYMAEPLDIVPAEFEGLVQAGEEKYHPSTWACQPENALNVYEV